MTGTLRTKPTQTGQPKFRDTKPIRESPPGAYVKVVMRGERRYTRLATRTHKHTALHRPGGGQVEKLIPGVSAWFEELIKTYRTLPAEESLTPTPSSPRHHPTSRDYGRITGHGPNDTRCSCSHLPTMYDAPYCCLHHSS